MKNKPWSEKEIAVAIDAYFQLVEAQQKGEPVNKAKLYRQLSAAHPARSAKSFEYKFQSIREALIYCHLDRSGEIQQTTGPKADRHSD